LVNKIKVMTKNEILDLIDTLNQYKAGNVTNKGLEEALQSAYWDGYPEYNGKILKECYSDKDKLQQLLELGDISALKEDLGKTEAYHRDLCKTYYPPTEFRNIDSFGKQFSYEYGYVLSKEGEWLTFENKL